MLCAAMLCVAWIALPVTGGAAAAQKQIAQTDGPAVEALKIVNMVELGYPPSLTWQGITRGVVDLVFGVDGEGRLDDYLITSYTKPEFAKEVVAALKQWRFEPMRLDGVPVWSRAELSFSFEARGVVITRTVLDGVTMLTASMLEASNRVHVLSRQSELDHPLAVANAVAPLYPAKLAESGRAGEVMVEFFVDEQGRVRLPVAEGGAHPWFGEAAVQAVMQWRFEPPMKKGWPTVVKVRQQFVFNP
ncbi:MAG: energy transducer TonB [Opitutaceae bacterium]|jgi:TonB family protein|nr:energy transducer TonB [Opitutaceae bacterium]